MKRQLNNAIAKSDWPTFSGDDKYDLVGFCRWIDMARSGSYVDDKVIMLKLMTQFTGSALTWFVPGINFKLLRLMDDEVEYAAKNTMKEPGVDLTDFINVLEDICIKTCLGRRRFPPRNSPQTAKDSVVPVNKPKAPTTLITCFVCNRARHTSRNCPKKVHNLQEDKPPEDKELSKYEPDGWRDFILPVEPGKFHSATGAFDPVGSGEVQVLHERHSTPFTFVVMDNMTSKYFIVGNDYLVKHKISLLNRDQRQFTIGKRVFNFDESINAVAASTVTPLSFEEEVVRDAKI
ncbi:hypothetical protein MJO28_017908, partial [Puccinia striiformis f. sp. tritici]